MISTVLVTLALSVPLAAAAWIGALAVDRTSAGLRVRRAVWMFAFTAPLALTPMALAVRALGWSAARPAPLMTSPIAAPITNITPLVSYEAPAAAPEVDWAAILLSVLAIGAAVRLLALIWNGLSLAMTVRRAEPLAGDFSGMSVRLYDGEAPVLAGLIRPVVLLPRTLVETLTPSQIALICAHERAHLRAGDHIANLWEAFAMALFWFNPVLGAIRAGLSAVREEACDAAALAGAERPTRRVYAEVLLSAIRHAGGAEPAVAFTGFYRARSARRLRAILTPQGKGARTAAAIAAGVGLIVTGVAGGLSFAFAGAEPSPPLKASPRPVEPVRIAAAPAPASAERAPASTHVVQLTAARGYPGPRTVEQDIEQRRRELAQAKADGFAVKEDSFDTADRDTLIALNSMLVATRLQRIEVLARLQAFSRVPAEDWPQLRNNADYKEAVRQRDAKAASYKRALANLDAKSEPMVQVRSEIEAWDARIDRMIFLVQHDMEIELNTLEAKETTIRDEIATLRNGLTTG